MPQQSKYTNEQFDQIFNEILLVLEKHQPSPDLSLMVLGNSVTHVLKNQMAAEMSQPMAEKFCQALLNSVKE